MSIGLASLNPAAAFASTGGAIYQNYENKKESARDRAFQERMSSTAWQRSVRDMKAAGINPLLAFDKGGASTPGGSKATIANPLENTASTAMQLKRNNEEIKLLQAQTAKTMSEKMNIDQNMGIKGPGAAAAGSVQNMIEDIKKNVPSIETNLNSARAALTDMMEEADLKNAGKNLTHFKVKKSDLGKKLEEWWNNRSR